MLLEYNQIMLVKLLLIFFHPFKNFYLTL